MDSDLEGRVRLLASQVRGQAKIIETLEYQKKAAEACAEARSIAIVRFMRSVVEEPNKRPDFTDSLATLSRVLDESYGMEALKTIRTNMERLFRALGSKPIQCRCGSEIWFLKSAGGYRIPVDIWGRLHNTVCVYYNDPRNKPARAGG